MIDDSIIDYADSEVGEEKVLVFDEFELERTVGITKFIHENGLKFTGILKHRFSDFKVLEIGLDGQVAQISDNLCDMTLIEQKQKQLKEDTQVSFDRMKSVLGSIITDETLLHNILEFSRDKKLTEPMGLIIPITFDKQSRAHVHQGIRALFKGTLQTEAFNDSQIRIYHRGQGNDRLGRDDRNSKPVDQQRYLKFILQKENMDTIDAIQLISRRLHMHAKDFSYAGTKDRRGLTTQWIVARNVTPNKILGINRIFESDRVRISNVKAVSKPLSLGDLQGNRFGIVIRNIEGASIEKIEGIVKDFEHTGFINYFGLQRFGTTSVPSYKIGLALLRGDYRGAVDLILEPRNGESDDKAIAARRHWKEFGDIKAAQAMFPSRYTAERQVLAYYARNSTNVNDHLGAILSINRELRLMYVHSVQSLLWNRMVSYRIAKYGQKVIEGDLVMKKDSITPVLVTMDNINRYILEDVVFPVPGYSSILPTNDLTDYFWAELKNLDLSSLSLSLSSIENIFKPKNKALWDLPGAYRKIFMTPKDLEYRIGYYLDPDVDLPSGFQNDGKYIGLYIAFSLPSSSYATMALRELMHCGTDPRKHKAMTKKHKAIHLK